jgi:hypothetical protein
MSLFHQEPTMSAAPRPGDTFLLFDGRSTTVQIPSKPGYSQPTHNGLTVSAWVRRDVADFPHFEQNHYVHWMGKGEGVGATGKWEWVCRMYGEHTNRDDPRPDRISFYIFNPDGHRGTGSYVQEPIRMRPPEWIHIVGVADTGCTHIFKNGVFKDCDIYRASEADKCVTHPGQGPCDHSADPVVPVAGDAPLKLGSLDGKSYFKGGITKVRIWSRVLTDDEIRELYEHDFVPPHLLAAEFLLNGNTGNVAVDRLGNDGRITDGAWAKV